MRRCSVLAPSFERLYLLIRSYYYGRIAEVVGSGKGNLTAAECFSLEILMLLDNPSIGTFASVVGISLSNATYRVNSLIEKGYVTRTPSTQDRRESLLMVTDKYAQYYGIQNPEVRRSIEAIEKAFTPEELDQLTSMIDRIITIISAEKDATGDAT